MCINCRLTYHQFTGFAVLDPIYGDSVSTGLVVAIISIIVNAITIPIGLYLLNPSSGADGKKNSNLSALISAAKEPVVWAPGFWQRSGIGWGKNSGSMGPNL